MLPLLDFNFRVVYKYRLIQNYMSMVQREDVYSKMSKKFTMNVRLLYLI